MLTLLEELAKNHPESPAYQQELASAQDKFGVLYQTTNRPEKAEKAIRRAVDLRRQLVKRFPSRLIIKKSGPAAN